MSKKIDLIGQKFGKLTVIKEAGSNRDGEALWECRCDCGSKKNIVGKLLRRGNTNSCGCLRETDYKNKKIGGFFVIEKSGEVDKSGALLWLCECVCGKIKKVSSKILGRRISNRCLCLTKKHKKHN